jgi:hypothetical protein
LDIGRPLCYAAKHFMSLEEAPAPAAPSDFIRDIVAAHG